MILVINEHFLTMNAAGTAVQGAGNPAHFKSRLDKALSAAAGNQPALVGRCSKHTFFTSSGSQLINGS